MAKSNGFSCASNEDKPVVFNGVLLAELPIPFSARFIHLVIPVYLCRYPQLRTVIHTSIVYYKFHVYKQSSLFF